MTLNWYIHVKTPHYIIRVYTHASPLGSSPLLRLTEGSHCSPARSSGLIPLVPVPVLVELVIVVDPAGGPLSQLRVEPSAELELLLEPRGGFGNPRLLPRPRPRMIVAEIELQSCEQ
jgi:hypothetical protein